MFCLKNKRVVIHTDANPFLGTGRVRRCLSLANALKEIGLESTFCIPPIPRKLFQKIQNDGFKVFETARRSDLSNFSYSNIGMEQPPGWVIADSDGCSSFPQQLDTKTVAFGGFVKKNVAAGACNIDVSPWLWPPNSSNETDCLYGPEFAVLENASVDQRRTRALVKRVLVKCKDNQMLNHVVRSLAQCRIPNLLVDIVYHRSRQLDEPTIDSVRSRLQIRIHRNLDRINLLANLADFAILDHLDGFEQIAASGLPAMVTVGKCRAVESLFDAGCCIPISMGMIEETAKQIKSFSRDRELRDVIAEKAGSLFDEEGTSRIARAMLTSIFSIRGAEISDADKLLQWRNDPELRVVCFQQEQIDRPTHYSWLQHRLESSTAEIHMIEDPMGKAAGQLRFEFDVGRESVRLHISLIPSLRGFGLGTAFIEKACRILSNRYPGIEVYAYIKSVNIVSQSAFRKAAFESDSTTTINGHVAIRFVKRSRLDNVNNSKVNYRIAS